MSRLSVLQILNSSLWITVLVVRVGCIIEAHPSPNNSDEHKVSYHEQYDDDHPAAELDTAASHSFISSRINGLLSGGRSGSISKKQQQPPTSLFQLGGLTKSSQHQALVDDEKDIFISTRIASAETTTTTSTAPLATAPAARSKHYHHQQQEQQPHEQATSDSISRSQNDDNNSNTSEENDDSCFGKADGYYQNLLSGCTSYYFCAQGYQATYLCPINLKFNGKRCENDYVCPTTTSDGHRISNDCENKSNGYYAANSRVNVGKYFYCFQKAKVIELQCDSGKIFVKDKCITTSSSSPSSNGSVDKEMRQGPTQETSVNEKSRDEVSTTVAAAAVDTTCSTKANGFYQVYQSENCYSNYYYFCLGGEKNELRCEEGYIFNGDICVHESRYECSHVMAKGRQVSQQSELKLVGDGSIDKRASGESTTGMTTSHNSNDSSSSSIDDGKETVTAAAAKLPFTSEERNTQKENDYYSRQDSSDGRVGSSTSSPHLNTS